MSQPRAHDGRSEENPATVLHARRLMPAGRALVVILVSLLVWTVLYAPTMKRAAEASPLGRPTHGVARFPQTDRRRELIGSGSNELAGSIERVVGRDQGRPGGAFVPPPEDIPLTPPGDDDPHDNGGTAATTARRPRPIPSGRRQPIGSSASRSSGTPSLPVSGTSPSASSCPGSSGFRLRAGSPPGSRGPTTSTGHTRCAG